MPRRKPKDPERAHDLPHAWIARHLARIEAFVSYDPLDLTTWGYRRSRLVAANQYREVDEDWRTIQVDEEWGGSEITAFFRHVLELPEAYANKDSYLDISLDGGEAQLSINGTPWQGLDWYRSFVPLGEVAQAGRRLELLIEAFVVNYPYDAKRGDAREVHRFERARLVKRDLELETFLSDAHHALEAYVSYWQDEDEGELERRFLRTLEQVCQVIGPHITSLAEARRAAKDAHPILRRNLFGTPLYQQPGKLSIVAHSHLDLVYLWPLKETLRKNCRTTTNMLSLMREYPDFRYSQSQPFLYEKLKEMHPETFEEVKNRVQEGRWEAVGAMYVEPDGNLLGAESLVRQIMFGKRVLRDELGVETQTCWLPDVFGVMYTLPQVLRKSGVKYFSTNKLNTWNDTNIFPYDSFRWRGLDGSEVLAHFPTVHFGQMYSCDNLRQSWRDYRHKQEVGEVMVVYGLSDGGGGPTRREALASLRGSDVPGLPESQLASVEEIFRRLEAKAEDLPVWDDELYLEAHRGTYTTKGDLKRQNRKVEGLYRDAEVLSSLASLFGGPRVQEELNEGWKYVLLNQFHDTLPGTHVVAAVPNIKADYSEAFRIGHKVRDEALRHLTENLNSEKPSAETLSDAGSSHLLLNTLAWERRALFSLEQRDATSSVRVEGEHLPVQHYAGRTWFRAPVPSLGWTVATFENTLVESEDTAHVSGEAGSNPESIETPLYRLELGANGELVRLCDKQARRDVLSVPGNVFQVFEDDPGHKYSAWDIAHHIEAHQYPVEQTSPWKLVANGPLFAVFKSQWRVLESTIDQAMWLYPDDPRIDFQTQAEWRDPRKLLKVAFPLQIRARYATFDLPFGHIERPTHRNTSWAQAKYEVCGHKWADMSEGDYGVALMNDCKYGYDAKEETLRLSLIRSPVRPDAQSDIGTHTFTYSLLPHQGGWRAAQVDRQAYGLNIPGLAVPLGGGRAEGHVPKRFELMGPPTPNLIVETLKQAEEGEGLILRTFDSHGCRTDATFSAALDLERVAETDLLEEQPQEVDVVRRRHFDVHYAPYEIKTHRLVGRKG